VSLSSLLELFWGPRQSRLLARPAARPRPRPARTTPFTIGTRCRLVVPIASSHKVWIPEGAVGIVVGGDVRARKVSVELDLPRTVITVPWAWVEEAPDEKPEASVPTG
jgi:hypothetical protein